MRSAIGALTLAAVGLCLWGMPSPAMAQDGLKIYISADMEGVTGAVTGEQLGPGGFEYQRFRQFLTDEVNAAIGFGTTNRSHNSAVSEFDEP